MSNGTVRAFVKALKGELGTKEGYNNDQKYGRWDNMPHSAWCGQYISWCLDKAGVPGDWKGDDSQRLTTEAVRQWRHEGRFHDNPRIGDIVFFNWPGGEFTDHVGAVIGVSDWKTHHSVKTIEGNSSKPGKPEGVYIHDRNKSVIVGFARPHFKPSHRPGRRIRLNRAPILSLGSKHRAVKIVQRLLDIKPTGVFDKELKTAVIYFQRSHRLTADGIVGPMTKNALLNR